MKTTVTYQSRGLVYGNLWGGGKGAYRANILYSDTKEDLIKQAEQGLDGSLDSGMGYESLIGALLDVETITTKTIKGKDYVNYESELVVVGDLTDEEIDFLMDAYYQNL